MIYKTSASNKQDAQRRILSPKTISPSSRLLGLGSRSPVTKLTKKAQPKESAAIYSPINTISRQSLQSVQSLNVPSIPKRATQNKQHKQLSFENQDKYEGGTKDNHYYGKGQYSFYQNGIKYVGQFFQSTFHGWGVLTDQNGQTIYQGNFLNGKKHGEGKFYYDNDHYYHGEWINDLKDGTGIYNSPDGLYNGNWKNNLKHGEGVLKLRNGTQFKGEFYSDQFTEGLIKYPNGDEYSGQVLLQKRHGQGSYFHLSSQQSYKGSWRQNLKHGRGNLILANGDQLQCTFNMGTIDQTQSCTFRWNTGTDAGSVFNGWFKNGKPEKGHVTKDDGTEFDTY